MYEAIRGSYHIFPIYYYDGIKMPYTKLLNRTIIKSQNVLGGFDYSLCSSACYDIDAIEPLIRTSEYLSGDTRLEKCLNKSFKWIMSNQNLDGGFSFARFSNFSYGGERELSSLPNESNMFATWFRTLNLLYILDFVGLGNHSFVDLPGYEMPLSKLL